MPETIGSISIIPVAHLPLIKKGDDLAALLLAAIRESNLKLQDKDILVISQKIISKAEGNTVDLKQVTPSIEAQTLSKEVGKDPRIVHLILEESKRVVRKCYGVLITEHKKGWICADAGVDYSNVPGDCVALLPRDPDATAETIRNYIKKILEVDIAVSIIDSQGRPFRYGSVGTALGYAGISGLINRIGDEDLFHYRLKHTRIALADQIASSALMVMGECNEGIPAAIVRGLHFSQEQGTGKDIIRLADEDLFH